MVYKASLDENGEEHRSFTLYLVRHGEAAHNILEKAAKKKARDAAMAEGLGPDEVQHRMEEARKAVLNDPTLFDAPLSELGKDEARQAHKKLVENLQGEFPPPTEVLVSPLTRALETADLLFPDHTNIRVREELRERQTGKACDTRQSSEKLRRRNTFQRFSMVRLRERSVMQKGDVPNLLPLPEENSAEIDVEEKHMLRGRTEQLFPLLWESKHDSIAVVTHKGYLRELERGPLGLDKSPEFKNCEIRVYQITMTEVELEKNMTQRLG